MNSANKQVLSFTDIQDHGIVEQYATGLFNVKATKDANAAWNYKYLPVLKHLAFRNFQKAHPLQAKTMRFKNILSLSGKMTGLF